MINNEFEFPVSKRFTHDNLSFVWKTVSMSVQDGVLEGGFKG